MTETNDMELLWEYAQQHSESAFAELVQRHLALVYSAALRHVGNPAHAEEIAQAVFVILACKAARLRANTVLAAWLYETTRLTALSFLRGERRRQFREQEAYMQSTLDSPGGPSSQEIWDQFSPMLDEAMGHLGRKDRDAVILRFFNDKSLHEVAATMDVSEAAAQRRVLRALEKLRKFFAKRGVTSTTATIAQTISSHSVQATPVALAKTVTAVAVVKGSIAAASTLTLVKGTMKAITLLKVKTAALLCAGLTVTVGTTIVAGRAIAQSIADSSAADDSAWDQMDTRVLDTLPPAFVLRPSHFAAPPGLFGGGMMVMRNKMLGRAITFNALMSMAYGVNESQIVSPAEKVDGRFDLLMTTPDASTNKLQKEIARQLGYTGRPEMQPADVLVLTVKQTDAPGLKPSQAQIGRGGGGGGGVSMSSFNAKPGTALRAKNLNFQNQSIAQLIKNLQGYFDKPIVDRTGLSGKYDVALKVETPDGSTDNEAMIQALSNQLGLEVGPSREPMQMLVVDKIKN
jgi:uncharacterized protein (TIGR03435 family)